MDSIDRITGDGGSMPKTQTTRASHRDSLLMAAKLRLTATSAAIDVRVRNLSPGGLMMEFDRVLDVGTSVLLEMRGIGEVGGKVAWCTRGRIGVAFDTQIDPKSARKSIGSGSSTPDYAKPQLYAPRVRRSL